MKTQSQTLRDSDFMFLRVKNLWTYFKSESLAFKSICAYMFVEMFRPQSIFTFLDFLPWAQLFLGLSLLGVFSDKQAKVRITGMHVLILLFAIVIHLSFITAYDIGWSTRNYIAFNQWVVIFFLITAIVTTKERFYVLFLVFFLCALKIAVGTARNWAFRGFSFTDWGLRGPPGFFANSGELAVLMLMLFPIGYYLYFAYKDDVRTWEKFILLAAMICPVLTILGASSRGAQVALVVQLAVMFWRKIFNVKSLLVIVVVAAIGWQVLPKEQKERFTDIGSDKTSIQRQLYWENGWEMMKKYPALGVGYFNFSPYFNDFYPQDMLYKRVGLPHNIFIQVGTDAGFIALFLFMMIIALALLKKYKVRISNQNIDKNKLHKFYEELWKAFKIAIIGFTVAGQFVTIAYYPFLWISISFMAAISNLNYSEIK
ncbi:O-antigen ligase family protein [Salinimonas chungwhensis]|uniref:O-antigen ligase family protein n=1 Tax=Salinimonas chungwhensis TaxID=265425 RepID=UPI00036D6A13|nr:O-antigen ligase family protein [Salinimonas chungwhensis]